MRAVRFVDWGAPPVLGEVAEPSAGAEGVVVRVAAAGLCHSDLHVLDARPGDLPLRPPFTLGHEGAGRVEAVGSSVAEVKVGDAVVVYGPWGCGTCDRCAAGRDNYCRRRAAEGSMGMGLGRDGAMAELVLVPSARFLVPLGDLDPVQAAPLADAGLTPYHAIAGCRHRLTADSVAVVIGVGGLGHLAVQLLGALIGCRVIAVDRREAALTLGAQAGASTAVTGDAARAVRRISQGRGADVVLDFVGSGESLGLAGEVLGGDGDLVAVGSGGGSFRKSALPQGTRVSLPFWGTLGELAEVVGLARRGLLKVETTRYGLSEAAAAVEALRSGRLVGRAVLVPG